jgi:selenocysteine-specific elongation factor
MIVGTAGHIDHGKTALVKALTGVDTDRLREEKARGITIDLGYAYHDLGDGRITGFVDVPGHERFVHNMLAGAIGIDYALLVVAADDGVMPQTREHLDILHLLGLARGAVALTKIDRAAPSRIEEVQAELREVLAPSVLAGAPIFPVSNVTGEGIDALKRHLADVPDSARSRGRRFRLAIDRSFTLAGTGTVVTGTIHDGEARTGDRLLIAPAGREVRVRSLHAQNRPVEVARAGQRCALNLAGIEKAEIGRGDWLLHPDLHAPTQRLDVELHLLQREGRSLKPGTPLHLHIGAADVLARVAFLQVSSLEPGNTTWAQLVLEKPVAAVRGDRFILRDQAAQRTLGGGRVLDPFGPARRRRAHERLDVLDALSLDTPSASLKRMLAVTPHGVPLDWFARTWNSDAAENEADMTVVSASGVRLGFLPAYWQAIGERMVETLAKAHREAPDVLGLNGVRLRQQATPQLPWSIFTRTIDGLLEERRIARHGAWFHLPEHRIRLSPTEQKRWQRVEPLLATAPFQPPRVRDVAHALNEDEAKMRLLLKRTALAGDTYLVAHDHYFLRDAVLQLARIAAALGETHGTVRAADFRDRIGTGRKLAIHILEFFDHIGFLKRVGDEHVMRNPLVLLDESALPPSSAARPNNGRDSYPGGATGLQIR